MTNFIGRSRPTFSISVVGREQSVIADFKVRYRVYEKLQICPTLALNITMRLDNELLPGHSAVLSKHDSPRFRYMKDNVNIDEQDMIKIKKGVFTNLQKIETNATRLSSKINDKDEFSNTPKHQGAMIMPNELSELSVYYKDAVNAVKDICVDEEVLVKGKIIIMNETDKSGGIKVPPNDNKNDPVTKENENVEFLSLDGSSDSSENDYENLSRESKCFPGSTFACDNTSGEGNCAPSNEIVVEIPPREPLTSLHLSPGFSSRKTLKSFLLTSDYNGTDFNQSTNKIPSSGGMHGIPVSGLAYGNKMGCRTTAPEFNTWKLACKGGNEAQPGESESSSLINGPSSGRITYSGPMLIYSGSVSIRSDSSSTRSFAFPILQPEWDSSPVQMGISEKRQHRKKRGWKQALVCCRF